MWTRPVGVSCTDTTFASSLWPPTCAEKAVVVQIFTSAQPPSLHRHLIGQPGKICPHITRCAVLTENWRAGSAISGIAVGAKALGTGIAAAAVVQQLKIGAQRAVAGARRVAVASRRQAVRTAAGGAVDPVQ